MRDLFEAARRAFENAYAPYSNFQVGVALRASSGRIYSGANAENAAYPIGTCAEAGAIAAMVTAGERRIEECVIVAAGDRLCTPCGGCRQRLAEFAAPSLPIHLCDPAEHRETTTLGALFPHAFDLENETFSKDVSPHHQQLAAIIRERCPHIAPRVGLILGSGLGDLADRIENAVALPYEDLPGFPKPSVEGHSGRLVLGHLENLPIACLQGRVHLYEGGPASAIKLPIHVLKALGCETVIVTNAAGSLRQEVAPGSVVLIEDHINMLGANPLIGPNDPTAGPRFPDMSEAYSRAWRDKVQAVADKAGLPLPSGVYLATPGPSFETPAEIRAFRALGADLVGMSTVPETIAARHAGLAVIGFSIVTNLAAGMSGGSLNHEETLREANRAGMMLERLLRALFKEMA